MTFRWDDDAYAIRGNCRPCLQPSHVPAYAHMLHVTVMFGESGDCESESSTKPNDVNAAGVFCALLQVAP